MNAPRGQNNRQNNLQNYARLMENTYGNAPDPERAYVSKPQFYGPQDQLPPNRILFPNPLNHAPIDYIVAYGLNGRV